MGDSRTYKKFQGNVLVVDDNWITLKLIESMLQNFGVSVVTLSSGREALAAIDAEAFDLLFLDCIMPELDGHEVASRIRARQDEKKNLNIVAFTSDDSQENRQMCERAGMNDMFPKPYSYDSMEELLGKYLQKA